MKLVLFGMLLPLMVFAAPEQLKNGDFKDNLENWEFRYSKEYAGKIKDPRWVPGAQPAVVVEVPYPSSAFYVALRQEIALQEDKIFRLSFDVRGKLKSGHLRAAYGQRPEGKSWKNLGLSIHVPVTENWTRVEVIFKAGTMVSGEDPRFVFGYGEAEGTTDVRNVSIEGPLSGLAAPRRKAGDVTIGGKAAKKGKSAVEPVVTAGESAPPEADAARSWTDTRGRKVEGIYKGYEKGVVLIETAAGKTLRVKISQLSDADKAFVKKQEFGE